MIRARRQRGNIFALLYGSVALVAVLSATAYTTLNGPIRSIVRVTQTNDTKARMGLAANILVNAATDADNDAFMEPPAILAAGVGVEAPAGGGLLPADLGLTPSDAWGNAFGLCVWDHGSVTASAGRLAGDNTGTASTQAVLAVISAGPDKQFQTTCSAYAGGPVDVSAAPGSDDLIYRYSYAEAAAQGGSLWTLNPSDANEAQLKDATGAASITVDRSGGVLSALGVVAASLTAPASASDTVAIGGGLLLDDAAATCGAVQAGALRLSSDLSRLEMCNGAAFAPFKAVPVAPGSDKQIIFNDAGEVAGAASLSWDKAANTLTIAPSGGAGTFSAMQTGMTASYAAASANSSIGFQAFRMRGTQAAPASVRENDQLFFMGAGGYGATSMSATRARMNILAAEDWTDTAQGTYFNWQVTAKGANARTEKMRLTDAGDLGLGVTAPASKLQVAGAVQPGDDAAACAAGKNGAIKYAAGALQVCLGSSWLPLLTAETDPKIGTLTPGQWCAANAGGTAIDCTAAAPVGPAGPQGDPGATGPAGADGDDGKSAYQIWLDNGNTGTEGDFLAALVGATGPQGPAGADATPGGADTQIQFNDAGTLGGDEGFTYAKATKEVYIGPIGPAQPDGARRLHVTGNGPDAAISLERYSAFPKLTFGAALGTAESPLPVTTNTGLGQINFKAYTGSWQADGSTAEAMILARVSGTAADANNMGTYLSFNVKGDGSTTNAERIRITSGGVIIGGTITTARSALHVNGAIQPTDDAAACAANKNGAIKYAASSLRVCLGTDWRKLATGEAWGRVIAGASPTLSGATGLASVARNAAGDYTVTITPAMATVNYTTTATPINTAAGITSCAVHTQTTTTVRIRCFDAAGLYDTNFSIAIAP